jgi:hypothetical protein
MQLETGLLCQLEMRRFVRGHEKTSSGSPALMDRARKRSSGKEGERRRRRERER